MKKIEFFDSIPIPEAVLVFILFCVVLGVEVGYPMYLINKADIEKMKEKYNTLEVLKYSGDTIVFVFHDRAVQREFNQEWKANNYGKNIQQMPVADNMRVLKYNADTIQIKFDNARFQRQFEKQWRKYSDHKLNHINQNIKRR